MLSEYIVAGVAAESSYGLELAHEWIKSYKENIASAGWATYSRLLAIKKDEELDLQESKITNNSLNFEVRNHKHLLLNN